MASYVVSYDLIKQGQNYEQIIARLKKYPTHWHMQQSVWIVVTNETAVQIRDSLVPFLDTNDKLFVGSLSRGAAWRGYAENISQWLKTYL